MGTAPTEFAEVIKFRFGAPVMASDGSAGNVAHVIVDAVAGVVTHVGIRLARFESSALNLPVSLLTHVVTEQVELDVTRDEIKQIAQPIPSGGVQLSHSTVADLNGKRQGRIIQVSAVQGNFAVHRLVVDRGFGRGEVLLPVDGTTRWDAKRVSVQLSESQARALINYRPDDELLREVTQALYDYPRLRIDLRGMQVRAVDGDVWLMGHVSSDLNSRVAEDQLVGIAGLADVHNELMTDTDLAAQIASVLTQDPRTHGQHIGVYPVLGEVRLRGTVKSQGARDAAAQVAGAVPGAEHVVNELHVDPTGEAVPIMAGITGEEDLVPGGG